MAHAAGEEAQGCLFTGAACRAGDFVEACCSLRILCSLPWEEAVAGARDNCGVEDRGVSRVVAAVERLFCGMPVLLPRERAAVSDPWVIDEAVSGVPRFGAPAVALPRAVSLFGAADGLVRTRARMGEVG